MSGRTPHRPLQRAASAALAGVALAASSPPSQLELTIANLRNDRGVVRICVTKDERHFPDCAGDPKALSRNLPASEPMTTFAVAPGTYSVSLIHDENENGKLDTLLGIPKEGFGFSRNPAIRFGPPRYDEVTIVVGDDPSRQTIRVRYLL